MNCLMHRVELEFDIVYYLNWFLLDKIIMKTLKKVLTKYIINPLKMEKTNF